MITRERLEELIKQGATIWSDALWYKGKIPLINTDTDEYRVVVLNYADAENVDSSPYVYLNHHMKGTEDIYDGDWCLEDLREDADRAEWEYNMTTEHTDKFQPPMWEDLPIEWDFYFVKDKYMFHFGYENHNGDQRVIVSKCEYACEYGSDGYHVIYEKFGNATKENYIKACEIVRDLFNKGDKE